MDNKKEILVGAHVSISGGLYKAFEYGTEIDATAIQIFTKSSRTWKDKPIKQDDIELFKEHQKQSGIKHVITHAAYLINLASNNKEIEKKSSCGLLDELERCNLLDIPYLVLHPGSHMGQGEEAGMEKISKNLDQILEAFEGKTKILLETTAGQGSSLGSKFEQLKIIRQACNEKRRIGFCFDTCHVFAAGYDISTDSGYQDTLELFDKTLGLNNLKAIHVNDSKTELNSHIDRHASIGEGKLSKKTFALLVNDKRLIDIPKILETPIKDGLSIYAKEIRFLKSLIK